MILTHLEMTVTYNKYQNICNTQLKNIAIRLRFLYHEQSIKQQCNGIFFNQRHGIAKLIIHVPKK